MKIEFEYEKDTKNKARFKEKDTDAVGTLYIRKEALKEMNYEQGNTITVEITGGK